MSHIRVWVVEGPLEGDGDYLVFDSAEEAGIFAAEQAEQAWDGMQTDATKPGPAITIRCYEMDRERYDTIMAESEEDQDA